MQDDSIDLSQKQDVRRWQKIVIFFMIVTAFLTLCATLYTPIFDGDIWFHLLYGKSILENHTLVPDHTLYSWTPSSNEHIYCTWIGQIIYYLLYKFSGFTGIIAFRYFMALTLFLAILSLARQRNTLYSPITWFAATLCILIINPAINDKPEALSFALMVLSVWNWFQIKQLKQKILFHVYLFPLVILFWVNTHGAFIFGCLFLVCIGLGETFNQTIYRQNALPRNIYYHLLAALVLSAGCIFITPYGYDYIHQLFLQFFDKQLHQDVQYVQAFYKTFDMNSPVLPLFADPAIVIILVVFMASLRKKQLDFVPIVSNLVFAFLFTRYIRTMFLWVPVFSLSIAYYASSISIVHPGRQKLFTTTVALLTFLLSGWILYHENNYPAKGRWLDFGLSESFVIDDEINFLQKNFPNARIGNVYDHGSYILWKMWPNVKVMVDARYFPYKDFFKNYFPFESGINIEKFIYKYQFDVIEIRHGLNVLIQWFSQSKEWKPVFYGKGAVIFAKSSIAKCNNVVRGDSVNNIMEYKIAINIFNTSNILKDKIGTDIILSSMKKNFKNKIHKKGILGLEYLLISSKMYDDEKYSEAIAYMQKAIDNDINDNSLYADELLMLSIENWSNNKRNLAVKNSIKSFQLKTSFAAQYNIALMSFMIETNKLNEHVDEIVLTDDERMIVTSWRNVMKSFVNSKEIYPERYAKFVENASDILNGNQLYHPEFIKPNRR